MSKRKTTDAAATKASIPLPPGIKLQKGVSSLDVLEFQKMLTEKMAREKEALKVYRPLPFQELYHECTAKEGILVKGNRCGGSLAGFVEDARAVLGRDPFNKYPKRGTLVCVGWGEPHIGNVIYKYLFEPGAFQIIYDAMIGAYRVFNPNTDPMELAEPAPPLIPEKYVPADSWAWIDKRAKIFKHCEVVTKDTHWQIITGNSNGSADHLQGINVHLYHIDEDVARSGWYDEAIARTMAVRGKIRWTAMPHAETDDIVNMLRRADEQAGMDNPDTVSIRASIDDNPYLPKEEVEASKRLWMAQGEDVYRMRVFGLLTLDSVRMYPGFETYTHNAVPYRIDSTPGSKRTVADVEADQTISPIQKALIKSDGVPPSDWCCYATIDPGHTVAAATFWAVPPPSMGCDQVVVFDELYIPQCDAKKFARMFAQKVGTRTFQAFIIDAHGGALREIGSGIQPKEQYRRALEELNVQSVETGHGFLLGSDDVTGREHLVRDWIRIDGTGRSKLLVVVDRCPNLCREMRGFKKKRTLVGGKKITIDEGDRRSDTHSVECLEYGAAHGLRYVSPAPVVVKLDRVDRWLKREADRARARRIQSRIFGMAIGADPHINLGPNGA